MKSMLVRLLLFVSATIVIGGCINNPKRNRYLIPYDYVGIVYVYYNVPEAAPLKIEDGYRLIIIPQNGITSTSSAPISGEFHDEFWLYSDKGRTEMSPYKLGGGSSNKRTNSSGKEETFFQFEILEKERPRDKLWSVLTSW